MTDRNGILIIDKPKNITSHAAVNKIRYLYGTKKVGHGGTLDPQATGVLIVLVGQAVKASEFATSEKKGYRAKIKLGMTSDTQDIWGKILAVSDKKIPREDFFAVLKDFTGEISQIPPMYSAIKINGQKLLDLARKGETGENIERKPRKINIYSLVAEYISDDEYYLDIVCSKGTYIRALCADIGEKLGCGAVMSELRRTFCGEFSLEKAHTLEEIEKMSEAERKNILIPVENLFAKLPKLFLPPFFSRLAKNGCEIYLDKLGASFAVGQNLAVYDDGGFIGMATVCDYPGGAAAKLDIRA